MKRFLIMFLFLFMVVGCENKNSLMPEEFKEKMEDKGYIVQNITSEKEVETTNTALTAIHTDYQVEYYKINNDENAKSTFKRIQKNMKEQKNSQSQEKMNTKMNSQQYILENRETYSFVSRIENTILYVSIPKKYKHIVETDIKSLGY